MGDYKRAEPLIERALKIYEKTLGPEHSTTAIGLNNLALLYYDMGDCSCVNQVISEITSHKDIMKRVLSKRNKVINVCVLIEKKTNTFYTYLQVKRLFTLSYYIGD